MWIFRGITKWAVELSEYDITFQPQTALKSQMLADFIVDFTPNAILQADKELLNLTEHLHPSGRSQLMVQET